MNKELFLLLNLKQAFLLHVPSIAMDIVVVVVAAADAGLLWHFSGGGGKFLRPRTQTQTQFDDVVACRCCRC